VWPWFQGQEARVDGGESPGKPLRLSIKLFFQVFRIGKGHVYLISDLVAQKTNGEFVLNLNYGGLSKPKENLDGISTGKFEMAQFCAGYHKEKNPSITVLELPFLGVKTLAEERTISQWLYRHPSVLQDFRRWNAIALMPSPLPQYNLIGVGQKPTSLLQLSGLNVRATGGIGRAMEGLGANPSPIVATEVRQALESGQINAVAFAPHAHVSFGTIASASWWTTNLNPGTVNCPVVANLDSLSRLSKAHRDALYGSINEALDYYIGHYEYNMRESWEPVLEDLGIEKVTFNEMEISYFRERVEKPAALEWIAEHERNGLPAQEIYSLVKIALAGENPEQAIFARNVANQSSLMASNSESQQPSKQEILDSYTFDKKNSLLIDDSSVINLEQEMTEDLVEPEPKLILAESNSDSGFIKGGLSALFVSDQNSRKEAETESIAAVTDAPIIQSVPVANAVSSQGGNYFGVPRNGEAVNYDADPLNMAVEWDLEDSATVGSTIASLSDFIGYQLITDNQTAKEVYGRKLPFIRATVCGAFQLCFPGEGSTGSREASPSVNYNR